MLIVLSFILAIYGSVLSLECQCVEKEVLCEVPRDAATSLVIPECAGVELVRSVGSGFVVGVKSPVPTPVRKVLIHRTTMDCDTVMSVFGARDVTLNQEKCTTTTSTRTTRFPTPPGGRPPVVPVDDDNDDDNDDDDDDDDQFTTTTQGTTTLITNTTTSPPSTVHITTTAQSIIVIRGHAELTSGLVISFVLVIGVGVGIVLLRLRMRRRRTERPIQLAEVSSSTISNTYQQTRSPRRRKASTASMESVSLFAVEEHRD